MTAKQPFVSISIPCYNGEFLLGTALASLVNQSYPSDRYEIIVVDDGSTDNTPAIVAEYPNVRYVRLEQNSGISAARNAGLKVALGTIYIAFDCDCKADPEWLANLVSGYEDGKAIGVGSRLVEPQPITRLATRYISLCDTLFAPASSVVSSRPRRPYQRLLDYIKIRLSTPPAPSHDVRQLKEVSELYGATSSFLKDKLLSVGGYDVSMTGIEDRDISLRLHEAFPGQPFYVVPAATIEHERGESLWQYLKRPVMRGSVNYNFHRKNNMAPPIFPFPLLYIFICLVSVVLSPLATLICAVLLPQLLYFWWPFKLVKRHQAVLIIFPYIQLLEEAMVIIGLAKGFLATLDSRWHRA
jgi:glycosyltransferase involved in cell wall biosynthesis